MKKVFAICAVALFAVSFTSCKKDYTCTCTYDLVGTATTTPHELPNQSKSDAEDACAGFETTHKLGDPSASCSL